MQHTDVVPADPDYWTTDPLSGEIRDGFIWGRGALDMKGTGISQLATFISLHRSGKPLNRDVVLVASADEEAGGMFGAGWLVEHHPEIFAGAGLLINEGGGGEITGGAPEFGVEVTQKVPVWIRFNSVDSPGHGSTPRATSSATRIVEALNIVRESPFAPRIIPAVDAVFKTAAASVPDEWKSSYANISEAVKDPEFLVSLQKASPFMHALTRDTCTITRMQGSNKINVIPPLTWAEIDCRILPDRPSEDFVRQLTAMVEHTGVTVEVIMAFTPAVSGTDSDLYQAIESVLGERYPNSHVNPTVSTGFTDSHFTRDIGIESYGFDPIILDPKEFERVHGNDERVQLDAFKQGVLDHLAIIKAVVFD
jgi:acetylornithine deacetylase/succinyl-diaminopimelate desuccinylase-like protein